MAGSNKVITSITGGKDVLRDDQDATDGEFIAFTDQESRVWETRPPCDKFREPVMNAKPPKILPHLFVDAEISMWMDGNMALNVPFSKLVKNWLKDNDMVAFAHPRKCIYKEAAACLELGKGNREEILSQVQDYEKEGYLKNNGMAQCNVIIRRHNKRTARFNERWWAEISTRSSRDQISFPYVLEKSDVKFKYLKGKGLIEKHPYFEYEGQNHLINWR